MHETRLRGLEHGVGMVHTDTLGVDCRCVYTDDTLTGGGLVRLRLRRDPDMACGAWSPWGQVMGKGFRLLVALYRQRCGFVVFGFVGWVSWVGFRDFGFRGFWVSWFLGFVGWVSWVGFRGSRQCERIGFSHRV